MVSTCAQTRNYGDARGVELERYLWRVLVTTFINAEDMVRGNEFHHH